MRSSNDDVSPDGNVDVLNLSLSQLRIHAVIPTDVIQPTRARSLLVADIPRPPHMVFRLLSMVFLFCHSILFFSWTLVQGSFTWARIALFGLLHVILGPVESTIGLPIPYSDVVNKFLDEYRSSDTDCAICWDVVAKMHRCGCLPCGHTSFHEECLAEWIRKAGSCPLCRKRV